MAIASYANEIEHRWTRQLKTLRLIIQTALAIVSSFKIKSCETPQSIPHRTNLRSLRSVT